MAFARFKNVMFERCDQGGVIEAAEARSDIMDIEYLYSNNLYMAHLFSNFS